MSPLLEVEDLALAIHGRELVSRVGFELDRGQSLGIVGETGSGKTLSCRALTGTLSRIGAAVTRGSARFDGVELTSASERIWRSLRGRRITLVPQSSLSGLDPIMRVGAQLAETVRRFDGRAGCESRVDGLLEQVGLNDVDRVRASFPHQLSGGMRQRVMIALAIAARPDLLVADEPTTALDVTVQRGILDLLNDLRREEGMSLVLVTHDLGVVASISDRITVMYAGVTVETGTTRSVLEHPAHPYTQALLAARPSVGAEAAPLVGVPGVPPSADAWPQGCRFGERCPHQAPVCLPRQPDLEFAGAGHRTACVRHEELQS